MVILSSLTNCVWVGLPSIRLCMCWNQAWFHSCFGTNFKKPWSAKTTFGALPPFENSSKQGLLPKTHGSVLISRLWKTCRKTFNAKLSLSLLFPNIPNSFLPFSFFDRVDLISWVASSHGHGKALGLRAAVNLVTYLFARPLHKGCVLSEDRTVQVRVLQEVRRMMV